VVLVCQATAVNSSRKPHLPSCSGQLCRGKLRSLRRVAMHLGRRAGVLGLTESFGPDFSDPRTVAFCTLDLQLLTSVGQTC